MLEQVGKQQQFELGQYIRDRYSTFLNNSYSERDIYVQSSDIDRTIMSAEAFLASLYKPKKPTDIWNTHLPWQPIPVHTTSLQTDHLIVADRPCDAFTESYHELMNSDKIKEFNEKHASLYKYLTLHSGNIAETMGDAVSIRDTLMIEASHNKT